MIDPSHQLSVSRQAQLLNISRGAVYYLPKPVGESDLTLMNAIDQLHLDYPFTSLSGVKPMEIQVVIGDITKQPDVDAIVNSANANLRMGSSVAGAIHSAAGPKLEEYCKPFAPLELGSALITLGFQLPNPWIIHVRAAHYINNTGPERYLSFAISSMLNTARDNGIQSLAMPAIGTSVFKFPPILTARIISKTLSQYATIQTGIKTVRICVINQEVMKTYSSVLDLEMDSVTASPSNR